MLKYNCYQAKSDEMHHFDTVSGVNRVNIGRNGVCFHFDRNLVGEQAEKFFYIAPQTKEKSVGHSYVVPLIANRVNIQRADHSNSVGWHGSNKDMGEGGGGRMKFPSFVKNADGYVT